MSSDIEQYIGRLVDLPPSQFAAFLAAGRPRLLPKDAPFVRLGDTVHDLAFIHSGIVRYFVILPNGDEATKDFSGAGGFTLSFGSAVRGGPAEVAISAITPCRLTVWPYSALLALYDQDPAWQKLGRLVAESLYVRKERRELSFLLESAETRYSEFPQHFPFADEIPQYFIASYLGVRPQSLSRLRKRVRMHQGE